MASEQQHEKPLVSTSNSFEIVALGTLSRSHSELVHFVRTLADLLFEPVAAAYRKRAIAVVRTGVGRDGALGIEAVKKMGGLTIAQDDEIAEYSGMPPAAISTRKVDFGAGRDPACPGHPGDEREGSL